MTWDGTDSLWHLVQSRGKLSVAADLHDPADQAFVRALALESDILIENFRPGRLEDWGLDPRTSCGRTRASSCADLGLRSDRSDADHRPSGRLPRRPAACAYHRRAGSPPARVGLSLGDSIASLYAVWSLSPSTSEKL